MKSVSNVPFNMNKKLWKSLIHFLPSQMRFRPGVKLRLWNYSRRSEASLWGDFGAVLKTCEISPRHYHMRNVVQGKSIFTQGRNEVKIILSTQTGTNVWYQFLSYLVWNGELHFEAKCDVWQCFLFSSFWAIKSFFTNKKQQKVSKVRQFLGL